MARSGGGRGRVAADEQTELTDPSSIPRKLRKEAPRPEKQYPLYRGRSDADGQVS